MSIILKKIVRLRGNPPHIIAKKIVSKILNTIGNICRKLIVKIKPIDIKNSKFINFSPRALFFYNYKDLTHYKNKLIELKAEVEIIDDANKICEHKFNLLGSGEKNLGVNIPWNQDFKTGYIWENRFYKDISTVDIQNDADVKVPWELSRFQHLTTLGKAYWITNDEKYTLEFKHQILDWENKNPVEMSVNWTCTMDVAIRAVNWIAAYYYFNKSEVLNNDFWCRFHKLLYLHGKYIYKNLENKEKHTGNHYLSNIVGLIWIGIYFGNFNVTKKFSNNHPRKWLEFGLNEIEKEMYKQVNNDGTNYEASTSYHRLVTELFLITTILCIRNNINFRTQYLNRLEKMCEFIMQITLPNGNSPLIGDADDGRLIIFSKYSSWQKDDFRHILAIAGEFFERNDFRYFGSESQEDSLWVFKNWKKSSKNIPLSSIAYEDGGYYILRNERANCIIRSGENSFRGEGTHSHNDQLSFVLNVDGEDFFIDPGAFIYTADFRLRNQFRSTCMHNTLEIKDFEQNDFDEEILFYLKEETFSISLDFKKDTFVGQHQGYYKKCGLNHKREITLDQDYITIIDTLFGNTSEIPPYYLNFILDTDVECEILSHSIYLKKNNKVLIMDFECSIKIKLVDIEISKSYGVKNKSKKIIIENNENFTKTKITFAQPKGDMFENYSENVAGLVATTY